VSGDQSVQDTKGFLFHWSDLPTKSLPLDAWYYSMDSSLGYGVDGILTTKTTVPNNVSLRLNPSIDLGLFHGPAMFCASDSGSAATGTFCLDKLPKAELGIGFGGDFRYRYGTFKQGDSLAKANQVIAGGSAYVVPDTLRGYDWILIVPHLAVSYYKPVSTSSSTVSVPDDIKADYLETEFHTMLGTSPKRELTSKIQQVTLELKYDGSQPMSGDNRAWQNLWTVQVCVAMTNSTLKPAVTYKSGKQGGFDYDKQVLIGVAMDFL
jgi:hypothetical protein